MTSLADDIRQRAWDQLRERDNEGEFLQLNYREWQAAKGEDYGTVLAAINRQLRRYTWQLYSLVILVPIFLGATLYLHWQIMKQVGQGVFMVALGVALSWYSLKYLLPRISALQETKTLYELLAGGATPGDESPG